MSSTRQILIIGGTGFIGRSLVDKLCVTDDVTLVCRNIKKINAPSNVGIIKCDRNDYSQFKRSFSNKKFDVVIDLIAYHPIQTVEAIKTFYRNSTQFIHLSTVSVYGGKLKKLPTDENCQPSPQTNYGKEKLRCEQKLIEMSDKYQINYTIIRTSAVYGPGRFLDSIWGNDPYIVDRILRRKPVLIPDMGEKLWTPTFVEDLRDGIITCIGNELAFNEVFNIVGPETLTHLMYFNTIAKSQNVCLNPFFFRINGSNIFSLFPQMSIFLRDIFRYDRSYSNKKINKCTGFLPKVKFIDGVRYTIEWLKHNDAMRNSDESCLEEKFITALKGKKIFLEGVI